MAGKKRIGFIGPYKRDSINTASGQIVRTTIFKDMLNERYGAENIYAVSTIDVRSRPLETIWNSIMCVINSKAIILMTHENGCKFFFPLLVIAKKLLNKRIFYNVIGGRFFDYLQENRKLIHYARQFDLIWVQMQTQIDKLKELGIEKTCLLPNTKKNKVLKDQEITCYVSKEFHFCTFSRISQAKGIELAIESVKRINEEKGSIVVTLDIYGEADSDYSSRFDQIMKNSPEYIRYRGCVNSDDSSLILSKYYMLLFPTTYKGEGFPGTIWDAFASGLPVIASDWKYNSELIQNGYTGFLYDYTNPDELFQQMLYAIGNPSLVDSFRHNCVREANKYTPEKVWPIVYKVLDSLF